MVARLKDIAEDLGLSVVTFRRFSAIIRTLVRRHVNAS